MNGNDKVAIQGLSKVEKNVVTYKVNSLERVDRIGVVYVSEAGLSYNTHFEVPAGKSSEFAPEIPKQGTMYEIMESPFNGKVFSRVSNLIEKNSPKPSWIL